jgi:hypothetical protein
VIHEASQANWQAYGYSDSAVIAGFGVIAGAFARAFPDRVLGLSLFPHGANPGNAFPNFTADSAGYVTAQLVRTVAPLAPGRLLVQADDLDSAVVVGSVVSLARENEAAIGWQTNKHGGTGAGCGGGGAGSCLPDAPNGHYEQLLAYGAGLGAHYEEVWSHDVVQYPQAITAATQAGLFSLLAVPPPAAADAVLIQNVPNPFARRTTIGFGLARAARVRLSVYDLAGRRLGVLEDRGEPAGEHAVSYDALSLANGVYYYRLEAGGASLTRAFVVLH